MDVQEGVGMNEWRGWETNKPYDEPPNNLSIFLSTVGVPSYVHLYDHPEEDSICYHPTSSQLCDPRQRTSIPSRGYHYSRPQRRMRARTDRTFRKRGVRG